MRGREGRPDPSRYDRGRQRAAVGPAGASRSRTLEQDNAERARQMLRDAEQQQQAAAARAAAEARAAQEGDALLAAGQREAEASIRDIELRAEDQVRRANEAAEKAAAERQAAQHGGPALDA